jgi:hypothetical protein
MLSFRQAAPSAAGSISIGKTLRACVAASAVALMATTAQAAVITTLADGTPHAFNPVNLFTAGPVAENGFVFTSTTGNSVFGYTGSYGLNTNGAWNGGVGSYIGLNTGSNANQFMTITFDSPVEAVLAFLNYAPGNGTPYIAAYDAANQLIESFNLSFSTPGALNAGTEFGFAESSNIIKSIRFGNAFIVATDLVTSSAAVPIPSTMLLMGLGLGALAFTRRRTIAAVGRDANIGAMA